MNIFDLFGKRPSVDDGVVQFQGTQGAVLLDVRTPEEYAQGHIPQSVNLPLDRIHKITYQKSTPLFVYCYSGARSGQACAWLARKGYQAVNIGGMAGYRGRLE